jgi:hypothetical protein
VIMQDLINQGVVVYIDDILKSMIR